MKEKSEKDECCSAQNVHKHHHNDGGSGAIYFFGMIGAAVYFVQQVDGFWPTILAVLKAFVWPAFLLYHIFTNMSI